MDKSRATAGYELQQVRAGKAAFESQAFGNATPSEAGSRFIGARLGGASQYFSASLALLSLESKAAFALLNVLAEHHLQLKSRLP